MRLLLTTLKISCVFQDSYEVCAFAVDAGFTENCAVFIQPHFTDSGF